MEMGSWAGLVPKQGRAAAVSIPPAASSIPDAGLRICVRRMVGDAHDQGIAHTLYESVVAQAERLLLIEAIRLHEGNLCQVAAALGIVRETLRTRMRRLGVKRDPAQTVIPRPGARKIRS